MLLIHFNTGCTNLGCFLLLLLLWRYTPRSLTSAFLMTSMHSDRSWAFLVHPLFPVTLRSAWMSPDHLSFDLSTFLFPSGCASNTLLGVLLISVLIKWFSHSSLRRLISVTKSVFCYMLCQFFVCSNTPDFCHKQGHKLYWVFPFSKSLK